MKVIDLLNKIANGEFQKEFKFIVCMIKGIKNTKRTNINWTFKDGLIFNANNAGDRFYYFLESGIYCLNDEIEIIEEEKEIEELLLLGNPEVKHRKDSFISSLLTRNNLDHNEIKNKINELVREINRIKKEGK